jgi:NTE family protein
MTTGLVKAVDRRRWLSRAGALGCSTWLGTVPRSAATLHQPGPRLVAVCLGSGSLHGFAHVGAVRAFERLGFRPDIIAGTSVGALAGVLWAAGLRAELIEEIARDTRWRDSGQWRWPRLGFATLDGLQQLIDGHVGLLQSLPTRFLAAATELATGRAITLERGPAGAAVAASAAVPLRFEPVKIDGVQLVDGALSAPIPVDAARAAGADVVIALDVAYRPHEAPVAGLTDVAFQALHILVNRLIDEQLKRADLAIRLDVHDRMRSDSSMQSTIEAGEQAVIAHWPSIQRLLLGAEAAGSLDCCERLVPRP